MTTTTAIVAHVDAALARLGWLATAKAPTRACAYADDWLPYGWVRIADDYATFAVGPADELINLLDTACDRHSYGEIPADAFVAPRRVEEWPAALVAVEQIGEGSCNDDPVALVTVATNAGIRFAAGPHGVSYDCLREAIDAGAIFATRSAAVAWADAE